MNKSNVFETFLGGFQVEASRRYPFAKRLSKGLGGPVAASKSFYFGISAKYQKHLIVTFQQSSKAAEAGQFTINAHISDEYKLTTNFDSFREKEFAEFQDGFYRLPSVVRRDKWWCLLPTEATSRFSDYWHPTSYDNQDEVVREAILNVCDYLEEHLLRFGGFL